MLFVTRKTFGTQFSKLLLKWEHPTTGPTLKQLERAVQYTYILYGAKRDSTSNESTMCASCRDSGYGMLKKVDSEKCTQVGVLPG